MLSGISGKSFIRRTRRAPGNTGGSGVGLSIVKAIMESMNQRYGVENIDNGVLFWFELDAVQTER